MTVFFQDAAVSCKVLNPGAVLGHSRISAKTPDVSYVFSVGVATASCIFETIRPQGTNIILCSGPEDAVSCDVYPRSAEDKMNLFWTPSPAQNLDDVAKKISDAFWYVGKSEVQKQPASPQKPSTHPPKPVSNESDPRIVALKRRW